MSLLGVFVLLVVVFASSGLAWATTFTTPVDADYGDITNSVYLSQDDFPDGAPAAVLVGSDSYTTALASTVSRRGRRWPSALHLLHRASARARGPNSSGSVSPRSTSWGLSTTVVDAVKAALPGLAADKFVVLSGADQYQNAALVAGQVKRSRGETPERVFIVPGDVYGSSLSAAAGGRRQRLAHPADPPGRAFLRRTPLRPSRAWASTPGSGWTRTWIQASPGFSVEKTIMGSTSHRRSGRPLHGVPGDGGIRGPSKGGSPTASLGIGEEQGGSVAYSVNFPDNVLLASHIARMGGAYVLTKSTGLHRRPWPLALKATEKTSTTSPSCGRTTSEIVEMGLGSWSFAAVRQVKSLNSSRVTGLSSASGPLAGGGALTVTGTGFNEAETGSG